MGGCRAGGPGKSDCGRAGWATGSRRREPSPFGTRLRRIEVALISDYSGAQNELAFRPRTAGLFQYIGRLCSLSGRLTDNAG
jgi:hypothetical protein